MGLDITCYSGLAFALPDQGVDALGDPLYDDGFFSLYLNRDFPGHHDGLPVQRLNQKRIVCSGYDQRDGFRAGSYGGYGQWREQLAALAGYAKSTFDGESPSHFYGACEAFFGPFHELINFSDCEGTIGPVISAKLALDFAAFQARADAHPDERFRLLYQQWRRAFDMAAIGGAVQFH